jgi:hypothetical protein
MDWRAAAGQVLSHGQVLAAHSGIPDGKPM